jgi:predicted Rossmann fold nucleotide-binding protein DprA/Smf involved in DNA uptake
MMPVLLSPNTQAILLLAALLLDGQRSSTAEALTPGEYKRLARHLRELDRQPADLIGPDAAELMRACGAVVDEERLGRLLARGFQLSQAVERWQARAIWVTSRADEGYPQRLKARLKEDAPAILYGCGDLALANEGGLAVVGSRYVDDALLAYASNVGRLCAGAGRALISGGARGIDQAALLGSLESGGSAVGVLAEGLERAALDRQYRESLMDGRLVFVSPYDPGAGFNVGNAMQRNKLIYALADAALVVNAEVGKGGTWAGAKEQLDKWRLVPLYVRSTGADSPGLAALRDGGALPWPDPAHPEDLAAALAVDPPAQAVPDREQLPLFAMEPRANPPYTVAEHPQGTPGIAPTPAPARQAANATVRESRSPVLSKEGESPADTLFAPHERSFSVPGHPVDQATVAAALGITPAQAKVWLERLVKEGAVEKCSRPIRYVAAHRDPSA